MKATPLLARRATLDSIVYHQLRDKIVSLTIAPGELIFENALASEFGVSRTPIRQAFFRLQSEELLRIIPQRGAQVSKLSAAKFKEAQFIRKSLELSAFAHVAERWDRQNAQFREAEKTIRDLIRQQKRAIKNADYVGFIYLDEEYHNRFLELFGNETLINVVSEMRLHLNRMRYLELKEAQHESQAIRYHEEILDAVSKNDVERAQERLRSHLEELGPFWEALFERHANLFE
jgi:GntR family transcriptional regulator, rspAB operon transcriptional repressor